MKTTIEILEQQLDSFELAKRKNALAELAELAKSGNIELPPAGKWTNMHAHSFFSYNAYGYSPSKFAWLAKKAALALAQIVDFDVLDGLEEFLWAGEQLCLKSTVGMETRVFVEEFSDKSINSPGEPGVSYHMGIGFVTTDITASAAEFLGSMKKTASERNREVVKRVNLYLSGAEIDYDSDVLPLSPSGNATERHICLAYLQKSEQNFDNKKDLAKFWADKLGKEATGAELLGLIRAKTMKRGGPGYVQPGQGSFPTIHDTNEFIIACGAIPTQAWLNGLSDGEARMAELLEVGMESGVAALNIVPDRNFTPGVRDEKLDNLYKVVELAQSLDMPVIAGTEMNSDGQKFVDDFASDELKPLLDIFLEGAHIVYGHSVLQKQAGLGYMSSWAGKNFESIAAKNKFFKTLGERMTPGSEQMLSGVDGNNKPKEILGKICND